MESGDFYEPSIASMGMKMRGVQLGILGIGISGTRPKKYPLEKLCTKPASCQMLWEDGLALLSLWHNHGVSLRVAPETMGDLTLVAIDRGKQESEKACGEFKIE